MSELPQRIVSELPQEIVRLLPDDCAYIEDFLGSNVRFSLQVRINQVFAEELFTESISFEEALPTIISEWYARLHKSLVESEVAWKLKTAKKEGK